MYKNIIFTSLIIIALIYCSIDIKYLNLTNSELIKVEIKGEVKEEKIIYLPLGSSFNDLLNYVELNNEADISKLSRFDKLKNNQIVIIEKQKQNFVSINNANIYELSCIPGIGKSTAEKIINYRNMYGSFIRLEDLKNVSGIGEKKYEKIKQYICL